MIIFSLLLVIVNSLVTSIFVRRYGANFKIFFFSWCGIILLIQTVVFGVGMLLPMEEEGLPFLFFFLVPVAIAAFSLVKAIKKIKTDNKSRVIKAWESVGITTLAQVVSWLAAFWFLPKSH